MKTPIKFLLILALMLPALLFALYEQESETYSVIVKNLRGAKSVDAPALKKELVPLLERVKQDKITSAIPPLQDAVESLNAPNPNPVNLYQDVMASWYFTDPNATLQYLFQTLEEGIKHIQTNQAIDDDASITHLDYEQLLQFLHVLINETGGRVVNMVLKDLSMKDTWFTAKSRRDFVFFQMSLELDWLKTILLVRAQTLEEITKTVDFQVTYQQKVMALSKFSKEPDYEPMMSLLVAMQAEMIQEVLKGLAALKEHNVKIQAVEKAMHAVLNMAPDSLKSKHSQEKMLQDLELVSSILHGLHSRN